MSTNPRTLRAFLIDYMDRTGEKQTDIARRSGLSISLINGLVKGRIALPGADKRRNLARALGVPHVRLLIEAGELDDDELRAAGVEGVPPADPVRAELLDKLARVQLTGERPGYLESVLERMLGFDRAAQEPIHQVPGAGNQGGMG